ncbi:ArpU family phage packaging/lysis transcriptional regulator [Limosilactobacillus sp.]|uniref:ArpU family phage packaging/lysis transcriptional regulator n=1 Tax=Limosilactobacillus sp. TaxID=2773925 RepID=UPI003F01FEFC
MSKEEVIFDSTLDVDKTIKNVKHFFGVDYPAAKRRAKWNLSVISSPSFDGMPKGTPYGNVMENKLINRAYCRQVVKAVPLVIDDCSRWSRAILTTLYIDGHDDSYCINSLPYQENWYYKKLKPKALIEFAEIYPIEELMVFKKIQ